MKQKDKQISSGLPFGLIAGFGLLMAGGATQAAAQSAGDTVYAKRGSVEVRAGTSLRDPVVAELNQGDEMTIVAVEGTRYQVRTATGATGYVSRLNVTEDRPSGGRRPLGIGVQDTRGPQERSSATAIRGLDEMAEENAVARGQEAALADARTMEEIAATVTASDVEAFVNEGGLEER